MQSPIRSHLLAALEALDQGDLHGARSAVQAGLGRLDVEHTARPTATFERRTGLALDAIARAAYADAWSLLAENLDEARRLGPEPQAQLLQLMGVCADGQRQYGLAADLYARAVQLCWQGGVPLHTAVGRAASSLRAYSESPRWFVSFTRADPRAHALARCLRDLGGRRVTVDEVDFASGRSIEAEILGHMRACTSCILLVGDQYLRRPWTARELQAIFGLADRRGSLDEALVATTGLWPEDAVRLHGGVQSPVRRVVPVLLPPLRTPPFAPELLWDRLRPRESARSAAKRLLATSA